MYGPLTIPIIVMLALAAGAALGQFWRVRWMRIRLRRHARLIIADAERTGQARILDAELKVKQLLLDESRQSQKEIETQRDDLRGREQLLEERSTRIDRLERELREREENSRAIAKNAEEIEIRQREREQHLQGNLERLAGLTAEQAAQQLTEQAQKKLRDDLDIYAEKAIRATTANAQIAARQILVQSMERMAGPVVQEHSITLVPYKDDDMKSRIIGRDGRNVRAFESITGVDVLLEEVPGQVVLSCHQPQRREIARQALLKLIEDGRIQPSRIAQVVEEVQQQLEADSTKWGRDAAQRAGIDMLSPELNEALGKLRFRSSASQNVLEHLVECAHFAAILAAELGLPPQEQNLLRRAAFLHDIGKGLVDTAGLSHAQAGAALLARSGESELVVNAVAAHHLEVRDTSILAPLVRTVDALSGARPGARREDMRVMLKRVAEMEKIATNFAGVAQAYAFQAGRELQVTVRAAEVSDEAAVVLAHEIAAALEKSLRSGAPVRVSVVRESRAQGYATWGANSASATADA
jgi:ribonuclease Y